jgi:hypothetical protein
MGAIGVLLGSMLRRSPRLLVGIAPPVGLSFGAVPVPPAVPLAIAAAVRVGAVLRAAVSRTVRAARIRPARALRVE